mgnify:CR=1 FL=1
MALAELTTPVTDLPGVGPARARALDKLGLKTLGDLLYHLPRQYQDRRQIYSIAQAPLDEPVCVAAFVAQPPRLSRIRRGLELVKVQAADERSILNITFFNQAYRKDSLRPGEHYIFYGRVECSSSVRQMTNPTVEPAERPVYAGRIVPVYPLSTGLNNRQLSDWVHFALEHTLTQVPEPLPETLRRAHQLVPIQTALAHIHNPPDFDALEAARRRLIFEELFSLTAGLSLLRHRREETPGIPFPAADPAQFCALLPFSPTGAQRRVLAEVAADTASGRVMNRLIQGDVGSGKTVIAAFGAWLAWKAGWQTALMAPTEILAQQHYHNLAPLLERLGMRVALLTGSLSVKKKETLKAALAAGELNLCIGTHAILTADTEFSRLGLVVTDEQHRFGVQQRTALRQKGQDTHVLVMSATPIPRTLAMIVYGDLELSIIDELPAGRQPVRTYLINSEIRERAFGYIRRHLDAGYQAYLICPAVQSEEEEAAAAHLKSAVEYAEELAHGAFGQYRVGLLHGKMRPAQKEKVMAEFAAGEIQLLVATTVVEVGVDVPNAVIMMIENAERFGLSQLHQLRGRVGRGQVQSHCILLSDTDNPETKERLRVLCSTNDGFKIAEEDLKQRGPGDFFGERQHGLPELKVADLAADSRLLQKTQQAAGELLARDPQLDTLPALSRRVDRLMAKMSL